STLAAPSNPQPAPTATAPSSVQPASAAAAPSSPPAVSPPTLVASIETRLTAAAPSPSAPRIVSAVNADRVVQEDYAALGRQTLHETVPRIAARAEPQIARVLGMAAGAYHLAEERAVAEASRDARVADVDAFPLQRPTAAA